MSAKVLRLTSPHMHGADVKALQEHLNQELRRWGVDAKLTADGEYGPHTHKRMRQVTYGLGIARADIAHGVTPKVMAKLAHPGQKLSAAEKKRRDARADWRAAFKKRFEKHGAALAVDFAKKHLGVTENPAGSNTGPYIDDWNRAVGTAPGPYAYWCGSFANACLVAAGFAPEHFMAYCPSIEAHARAGVDGWKWYSAATTPKPGWLVLYTEGGIAGHVELCVGVLPDGRPETIGGNTSKQGDSGSQSNGGGVFEHTDRYVTGGFPIRGYCAPNYDKV